MKTYKQAQADFMAWLAANGWTLKTGLKVPYATKDCVRLWFKPQAIWFTVASRPWDPHEFKYARTLAYDLDIRSMSPEQILEVVNHRAK